MKRSDRLGTLAKLAAMAEQQARLQLAQSNKSLQRQQGQQRLLETYDMEYARLWLESARTGMMGSDVQRMNDFRSSLRTSLDTQETVVRQAVTQVAESASQWQGMRNRLRVFKELADRVRNEEDRAAEKHQEKALGDLASTQYLRSLDNRQ